MIAQEDDDSQTAKENDPKQGSSKQALAEDQEKKLDLL